MIQNENLRLIRMQLTVGRKSMANKGCSLWNKLPDDIKSITSYKTL